MMAVSIDAAGQVQSGPPSCRMAGSSWFSARLSSEPALHVLLNWFGTVPAPSPWSMTVIMKIDLVGPQRRAS